MGTVVRAQLKPDPAETASGSETLAEEMAEAYKDISNVVEVVYKVGRGCVTMVVAGFSLRIFCSKLTYC